MNADRERIENSFRAGDGCLRHALGNDLGADTGVGENLEQHAMMDVAADHVNFLDAIL